MMARQTTQQGAALVVALIFLVILMLVTASAVRLTTTNTRIAGNLQTTVEAQTAAQNAIEQVIMASQTRGADGLTRGMTGIAASQVIRSSAGGSGRSGADYVSAVTRQCIASSQVDELPSVSGTGCAASGKAGSGASGCFNLVWNIHVTTRASNAPGEAAVIDQGVSETVGSDTECSEAPSGGSSGSGANGAGQ